MTPPKVRFLRPNKVSEGQKSFWGAPKIKKIDFLKKPEFFNLSEHGGSSNFRNSQISMTTHRHS